MPTLRLTQSTIGENRYHVELALEGESLPRQTAKAEFDFDLSNQVQEDLCWYLENFLQFPFEPASKIATRIEQRVIDIGIELFKAVFHANKDAQKLWAALRRVLHESRIEIATKVQEVTSVPWELMRDPKTYTPLALYANAFVRTYTSPSLRPFLPRPAQQNEPIRILLVIYRPDECKEVPFRSVATHLVKRLSEAALEFVQLDVLRPPTFEQLSHVLRAASDAEQPYHVLHFDGYGTYQQVDKDKSINNALLLSPVREGSHGYFLFENPDVKENQQLVDGLALGKLLVETQVPVLVLNACRSVYADPPREQEHPPSPSIDDSSHTPAPSQEDSKGKPPFEKGFMGMLKRLSGKAKYEPEPETKADAARGNEGDVDSMLSDTAREKNVGDVHSQVCAFGSLAQEIMNAGIAGVVAMRYNMSFVTAAQFVGNLYAALVTGLSLGEAVTFGRQQLQAQRQIDFGTGTTQDWLVPVVFESAAVQLFPTPVQKSKPVEALVTNLNKKSVMDEVLADLPAAPEVGFIGRDETLLALEQAFAREQIVLLHAYAGRGNTSTAVEFARWYKMTGGVRGSVLFTSFATYKPLGQVLEDFGQVFAVDLKEAGVNWSAKTELAERRHIALQVLQQIPVLWIWDNVELVTGLEAGTDSVWRATEQQALVDFLWVAQKTSAKFLLTSRRDEQAWLGHLPARVQIPSMPHQERAQLANALADKYGHSSPNMALLQPLLEFTQGNPLTITLLVKQALREDLYNEDRVQTFLEKLRGRETAFTDEKTEGWEKSLGASISYVFDNTFTEDERKQLAVLYFCQGFVDVDVLRLIGGSKVDDWRLPEFQEFSEEEGIELLNRAAKIGLLTAHGGGFYHIHPALPWYFKQLFDTYYPSDKIPPNTSLKKGETNLKGNLDKSQAATRAFVKGMGELGNYYAAQYESGKHDVIDALTAEETNLLYACRLALAQSWWDAVIKHMQGLRQLYAHTCRHAEWAQLVEEIIPEFVDMSTDKPLVGREEQWSLVTEYRVCLAKEKQQWAEAKRLQLLCVEWDHQRAMPFLGKPLKGSGRHLIQIFAMHLHDLGDIQRECEQPKCVKAYEKSLALAEQIGKQTVMASCAFNLGHAYLQLSSLCNLAQAAHWYQRSFELRSENDRQGRGKCLAQLGLVAYKRFDDVRAAGQSELILLQQINEAVNYYQQALAVLPDNAVNDLAVTHNQLGNIYNDVGDLERALPHYCEAIRYFETVGNLYYAANAHSNIAFAIALQDANRFPMAMEHARAALRNYQSYPQGMEDEIQKTSGLIEELERLMRELAQCIDL
jgi:tetratricopeptide (TPR) repeat protein